jgi:hypothetical protein
MTYEVRPRPFNPKAINGQSKEIRVSHYESSSIGAIKRLNAITAQLAELDYAKAPAFMINDLKRKQLIAANSMICMRPILRVLAVVAPRTERWPPLPRVTPAAPTAGGPNSQPRARPRAVDQTL